jgi:endogenous inhibitor of DNA gyrase (YacG/DUF329 family)
MSAWLHLRRDILMEFLEAGRTGYRSHIMTAEAWLVAHEERTKELNQLSAAQRGWSPSTRAMRLAAYLRRKQARQQMGPCVKCGTQVPLTVKRGKLPIYCSPECRDRHNDSLGTVRKRERRHAARVEAFQSTERRCERCKLPITKLVMTGGKFPRFCSSRCRQAENAKRFRARQRGAKDSGSIPDQEQS